MKKLLSLVLALMMMLSCVPALAADEGYSDYTHPTKGYSLEYPNTWLALDSANIESLMNSLSDNEGLASLNLSAITPQITQMEMTMFIDLFSGVNINIVGQEMGMSITAEEFMPMMPMMGAQVSASLPDAQLMDTGSLHTAGNNQYCTLSLSYLLDGQTLYAFQFYAFSGTTLYVINLTMPSNIADTETVVAYTEHLLATLKFPG